MNNWDDALARAARICDEHAEWYPEDIFTPVSVGYGVRWKCRQLAAEIRELQGALEDVEPTPSTERGKP